MHGDPEQRMRREAAEVCELRSDNNGAGNSLAETTCTSINQKGNVSERAEVMIQEIGIKLPEDVFHYIYSLVPMQDAARAACTSREFLRSWRRCPRLVFNIHTLDIVKTLIHRNKETRAFVNPLACTRDELKCAFTSRIDRILNNHSGIGLKGLIIDLFPFENIDASYIDKWLQIAVKAGIEKLSLGLTEGKGKANYNFPCSLLYDEIGGATVQSLRLSLCAFRPTSIFGFNKSLKSLRLFLVQTTGPELGQFVSNCLALVSLSICRCDNIICFKVSCPLQQLNRLEVKRCKMLQVIEINAPKLSSFVYGSGGHQLIRISLGAEVNNITMEDYSCQPDMLHNSCIELLSFMLAVERLTVVSHRQIAIVPMMPSKFLHLKYLNISLVESSISNYNYFSLIPFLSASRTLETFILRITCFVHTADRHHDSVLDGVCGDQLHLRQIPGCLRLDNLKNLRITRFRPSKSLVELTSHIVQNAAALLRVTLDAAAGCRGRRTAATNWCSPMNTEMVREAHKGAEIARKLH